MGIPQAGLIVLLIVLSVAGSRNLSCGISLVNSSAVGCYVVEGTTSGAPPLKPKALFVFGDSYADTGNQRFDKTPFTYPYGITWPGYPTGRYSNGHVQTDYLAAKLGLPSPTRYEDIANGSIATGINFALGGSGMTYALGVLPFFTQVDQFEVVLDTGAYSPSFLNDSVVLISLEGNDYISNYTSEEFGVVVQEVVEGLTLALTHMYHLGLKNVLVGNLAPINCIPLATFPSNHTICDAAVALLVTYHNELLLQSIAQLNTLPDANFIILDENKAFNYIFNNTALYGITEKLAPCCSPANASVNCGNVDSQGKPLYTLCNDPSSHLYWDQEHPVESTWNHVVDLYYSTPGFVIGATSVESWLRSPSPAPADAPNPRPAHVGAYHQLIISFDALLTQPDYAESLGLLQTVNWKEYLTPVPVQIVTVFLPNNEAYNALPGFQIDQIFGQDKVVPVAEFHVVKGYYELTQFAGSARNLTTISGMDLLVQSVSNEILVGPMNFTVVAPDLFKVEDQFVIHGINGLLIPPNLQ